MIPVPVAPDDKSYIFGGIFMLANRMQALGDASITGELTTKQWFQLLVLRDLPAGCSIQQMADDGGTTRQNVKKLLAQLAAKGYVVLRPNPEDKRSTSVYMTDKGKAYMRDISKTGGLFVQRMFHGIPEDEIKAGKALVQKLVENLEAMKGEDQ